MGLDHLKNEIFFHDNENFMHTHTVLSTTCRFVVSQSEAGPSNI